MKRKFAGAGIAGLLLCAGVGFTFETAEAGCRQMLAPNGWQYITVCDGYRGGANYSGAISAGIAAAGIAAELLPGIMDNLGDVTNGVTENLGNAGANFSDPLQNFLSSTNQNTGGQNDGTLNPFNIFRQQPEAAAPKQKNAKQDESPSLFPNIFAPQAPTVNAPHVNTPAPQANAPTVNAPFPNIFAPQTPTVNNPRANTQAPSTNTPQANTLIPNIFSPLVNTPAPRVNSPQVRTPAPQVYDPMVR